MCTHYFDHHHCWVEEELTGHACHPLRGKWQSQEGIEEQQREGETDRWHYGIQTRKKENLGSNLDSKIVRNHDLCGDVLKEKGIRWEGDGEIMHFCPKVTNEYKLKCQTKPTI